MGHYIQNTGDETLRFLELFRSDRFADISLNQWMALTPPELVQAHLNLDAETMAALSRDKPVIVRPQVEHQELQTLPAWPTGTIAVLSTTDGTPHAIPVSEPLRAGDRRILFSLARTRRSLARIRVHPQVALAIIGEGGVAFTARGHARIAEESMARAPGFAAVELEVEELDDHRQAGFVVDSSVAVRWTDEHAEHSLDERVAALRELAGGEA
jgi:hypothetical protein